MWETLQAIGLPEAFVKVLKLFYTDNRHFMKMQGGLYDGPTMRAGVRQGCPLSGLLFAACVDVLLTRLAVALRDHEMIRAYADDIAMVIRDYEQSAPTIARTFSDFGSISALHMNIKKTIFIPLWPFQSNANVRLLLRELCPQWKDIGVDSRGKLLGMFVGPGADDNSWHKPLSKFHTSACHWSGQKLGLSWNVMVFNTFLVPVLEFVGQLCIPSQTVRDTIADALRRLAAGPGNWCTIADLEHLDCFGLQNGFRTIDATAKAAKLRLVASTFPDLSEMARELLDVQLENLRRPLGPWHMNSFVSILQRNQEYLQSNGITANAIKAQIATSASRKPDSFQAAVRKAIVQVEGAYNIHNRIRHKFKRWRLEVLPGHIPARVQSTLHLIGARCRPCIAATLWRTMWNGWPTSARMRQLNDSVIERCALGCTENEDRIEHYAHCPIAWRFLGAPKPIGLGLAPHFKCLAGFLCIADDMQAEDKINMAIGVYAVSRTVQQCRETPALNAIPLLRLHAKYGQRAAKFG